MSTTHFLLSKYPNAGVVLGGDKNNLNISTLLTGISKLKQIVSKFTHNFKILDVILTNLHWAYSVPIIAPPVPPDDPRCGVPSDHSTPIATPLTLDSVDQPREYITKTYRPLPESGIREFGQGICNEALDRVLVHNSRVSRDWMARQLCCTLCVHSVHTCWRVTQRHPLRPSLF